MAKLLGKTHKSKVLGADTHSVSLRIDNGGRTVNCSASINSMKYG